MIFTGVNFGLVLSAWFQWMLECVYVLLLLWKWAFHKPYLISCEGELVPEIWTGQFRIEFPWGLSLPLSATLVVLTQPRAGPRPGPDPHHRRHLRGLDSVRNSFWSSSVSSRKTAVIAKRQSDCDCPPVLDSSARAVTTVGLLPGAGSRVAGLSWLQDSARCEKHRAPQRRTDTGQAPARCSFLQRGALSAPGSARPRSVMTCVCWPHPRTGHRHPTCAEPPGPISSYCIVKLHVLFKPLVI